LVADLDENQWSQPTPAAGWDVRDQVSHLAHTEELAYDTVTGGPRSLNSEAARYTRGEDLTEAGCDRGRAMKPPDVLAWGAGVAERNRAVLRPLHADDRVPWGLGMSAPAFVTARLMEHWAHGLDIRAAVGAPAPDTPRLRHVAWIGVRSLPYAFSVAGV